ncbi:hypothetical protein ACS0TY_007356 [Phlomoides rotata]
MSRPVHFTSKTIPGCGLPDGRCLPCSGVSGKALSVSPNSFHGDCKLISDVKFLSLRTASRYTSAVCYANSNNYRRNSDFTRQNKHGFSRNRNRHNEVREENEDLEEPETFSARNGPVLSFSGNQKFQATSTPGPREKEIVELFRKVQAQLRERAAMKEGRKIEDSQGKSKESETVDSLLKLLRKHSIQQGKKSSITVDNRDFILDQDEKVIPSIEEKSAGIRVKHEIQESPKPQLSRPKSNFRKRSPVPEIKIQPFYSEDSVSSTTEENKWISLEPEGDAEDDIHDVEYDSDSDVISEGSGFDEVSEIEHDDVLKEVVASDLSGLKLTELRALAKSRGLKGFSKLKKNELIELLLLSKPI